MRISIFFVFFIFSYGISYSFTQNDKTIWDAIYSKIKNIDYKNEYKISYLKNLKKDSEYQKYFEIFDYVILKIELENKSFCSDKKYCYETYSCLEAKVRLNYCWNTSLDKDNDNIACENLCK